MNCSNYCVLKKRSTKIKSESKEHQKADWADRKLAHRSNSSNSVWLETSCITTQDFRFCKNKSDKCWIVQRTKQGTRLLLKEFRRSDKLFPLAVTNFCNTRVPNHLPGGGREEQTVTVWVFMAAIPKSEDVTKVLNKSLRDQKPRKYPFAGFNRPCMRVAWGFIAEKMSRIYSCTAVILR